jgi:hypothetical protein
MTDEERVELYLELNPDSTLYQYITWLEEELRDLQANIEYEGRRKP